MRKLVVLALSLCAAVGAQEWQTGVWHGRDVVFKVVDGMAIAEGDILLGPAAELVSTDAKDNPARRESTAIKVPAALWPNATIPYVIDSGLPDQQRVTQAIEHWNERTPMRLVPRTNESAYVRFVQKAGECSSSVGRTGREQVVNLADFCTAGAVIHEIGHAAGLFHEQSRHDRDFYITLNLENVDKREVSNFNQHLTDGRDLGGYDYGSIMHYDTTAFSRNGKPVIQTIPAGIPINQRDALSADDIDAIRRLYGFPIGGVTISTFPFQLEIEVDGENFRAPRTFQWAPGTRHTIGVPDVQGSGNLRHVFGRWSDDGARTHSIVVDRDRSVYTAHMVQQYRFPLGGAPADGGRVIVNPPSADGYYAIGTELEVTAVPNDGYYFRQWSGLGFFDAHGVSPNPLRIVTTDGLRYTANFIRAPVSTVTSEPPGLKLRVDGEEITTPKGFVWSAGSQHTVSVENTTQTTALETARHKFLGWSDGGDTTHTLTAGTDASTITARFQTQHLLVKSRTSGGQVDVNPAADDDFYDTGATVQVVPRASSEFRFQNWTGDLAGSESPAFLTIDDQKLVSATFALPGVLTANSVVHAASMLNPGGVAPGTILSIFGADLVPENMQSTTRVFFDEFAAPLLYVSRNLLNVVAPYGIAGRPQTTLRIANGSGSSTRTLPVLPAAPAIFTADLSGKGQAAALNQDGSYNSAQNPAVKGSVVVLYASGEGETTPASVDGRLSAAPLPRPKLPVRLRIAGRDAIVDYAGAAPGLIAGLMQVNVRIPDDCPSGAVPVVLSVGEHSSLANVSIAVQ